MLQWQATDHLPSLLPDWANIKRTLVSSLAVRLYQPVSNLLLVAMCGEGNRMVELLLLANQEVVKATPHLRQVLSIPFTVPICWLIKEDQRMERVAVLPVCWQA